MPVAMRIAIYAWTLSLIAMRCNAFQPAARAAFGRMRSTLLSSHALSCEKKARSAPLTMVEKEGKDVSHVFDVFIEDTDCFQVVYNANYLKFFDRARQAALGIEQVRQRLRDSLCVPMRWQCLLDSHVCVRVWYMYTYIHTCKKTDRQTDRHHPSIHPSIHASIHSFIHSSINARIHSTRAS